MNIIIITHKLITHIKLTDINILPKIVFSTRAASLKKSVLADNTNLCAGIS